MGKPILEKYCPLLFVTYSLLLVFFVASCGPGRPGKTTIAPDKEILMHSSCALPCWGGIIPGQTNKDAFTLLLKQRFGIFPSAIDEYPLGSGMVMATRDEVVFVQDDIIQVVCVDAPSRIHLSEIVQRYGEPTKIQIASGFIGTHQAGYDVRVYYPKSGLVIHTARKVFPPSERAEVETNLVVNEICLFPIGSAEDILSVAAKFQGPTTLAGIYELPLQDWHGYGDYEILQPP